MAKGQKEPKDKKNLDKPRQLFTVFCLESNSFNVFGTDLVHKGDVVEIYDGDVLILVAPKANLRAVYLTERTES